VPSTHRAVRFHAFGGLDQLRLENVPTPIPGPDDVLVRVRAAAVNHLDIDIVAGASRYPIPLPHTLGMEGAGVIESVGGAVTDRRPGQRVMIISDVVCGRCEACRSGRDNLCPDAFRPGWTNPGTYADFVLVPSRGVLPLPDSVSDEQAAVAQIALGTAWHVLINRADLRAGEWALVNGAGGGVGSSAVQIARLAGARVIAASASKEKRRLALADGAEAAADYSRADFVDQVRAITGGRGVDLVFDFVGGELFQRSLDCLRSDGRLVFCGAHGGEVTTIDLIPFFRRELRVIGSNSVTQAEIRLVVDLVDQGKLRVPIGQRFPLERFADALRLMVERRHYGRMLLNW
jgi:NADPH:quinone reductase-like Zn-dependent oxidoreductase